MSLMVAQSPFSPQTRQRQDVAKTQSQPESEAGEVSQIEPIVIEIVACDKASPAFREFTHIMDLYERNKKARDYLWRCHNAARRRQLEKRSLWSKIKSAARRVASRP